MKYLITGITGFAAPHLAKQLIENGHTVYGTYRKRSDPMDIRDILGDMVEDIHFVECNLLDDYKIDETFISNRFDGVFHLAAFTHPPSSFNTPELVFRVNTFGTISICEAIAKHNPECILMQCSTSEVYGICSEDKKIDETFIGNPMNPYAVSKYAADLYVAERARNSNLRAFLTRAFSHTGPRRRSNYSISSDAIQIAKILKGKQEKLIKVGNLKAKRNVMDVRDVVDVYCKLMSQMEKGNINNGELFHICGNEMHEIGYYLDIMLKAYGLNDVKMEVDPKLLRPIDIPVQYPSSEKVRRFLGWEPQIDIKTTLRDLVEYYLKKET